MTPKYEMVTGQMIWEVFGYEDHTDDVVNKGRQIDCISIADKLNKLIDERCPYCKDGMRGCHCWNDE